jgi:hypothetical protein
MYGRTPLSTSLETSAPSRSLPLALYSYLYLYLYLSLSTLYLSTLYLSTLYSLLAGGNHVTDTVTFPLA